MYRNVAQTASLLTSTAVRLSTARCPRSAGAAARPCRLAGGDIAAGSSASSQPMPRPEQHPVKCMTQCTCAQPYSPL